LTFNQIPPPPGALGGAVGQSGGSGSNNQPSVSETLDKASQRLLAEFPQAPHGSNPD